MSYTWDYPLYLLPNGPGYVSLVEAGRDTHCLAIYTSQELADVMVERFDLATTPRALANSREFAWLVRNLKPPVTRLAFDPDPDDDSINAAWQVDCQDLLDNHLTVDFSPWNYPAYVIANDEGFVCIDAEENQTAISLFTSMDRVERYLDEANEAGTACRLGDVDEAARFFRGVAEHIDAVAVDPQVTDGGRSAKHCFLIETLLTRYLVYEQDQDNLE